ncbi:MAG: DUF4345 domain-containing protein [Acidobacteriota bacterium]
MKTRHMNLWRMNPWPHRIFLFLSGLLLLGIGASILLVPHAFFATNGITLGASSGDPNLLSEIRAPGGLLTASALLILLGAFRSRWSSQALALSVLVYGSFGLARALAIALDGMPAGGILAAMVIELSVATVGALLLARHSRGITRKQATPFVSNPLTVSPATR